MRMRWVKSGFVLVVTATAIVAGQAISHRPRADAHAPAPIARISAAGIYREGRDDGALGPGGASERIFDIDAGPDGIAAAALTTRAVASSRLDRDADNGLRIAVDGCSVPWTSNAGHAFCSGDSRTLVPERPVIGASLDLAGLRVAPGGAAHLRVALRLPDTAGNDLQNLVSTIQYTFSATA